MSEPHVLTLSQPVQAHGETLNQLTIRPPTGKDLRVIGTPFVMEVDQVNSKATPVFDGQICARMLSALAGVPISTLDALAPSDFFAAQYVLLNFIAGDGPRPSSTASTTPPGSGVTSPTS